jgi:hypothetical protein
MPMLMHVFPARRHACLSANPIAVFPLTLLPWYTALRRHAHDHDEVAGKVKTMQWQTEKLPEFGEFSERP